MSDKHYNRFDCSLERFVEMTGLSIDIVKAQLKNLEERKMIDNDHKPYCVNKPDWRKTKANTYRIYESKWFAKRKDDFAVIPKQRKVDAEQYEAEVGWLGEDSEDFEDDNIEIDAFRK